MCFVTRRKGIGNSTSTLRISTLFSADMCVTVFNDVLNFCKPSSVERSHVSVKSSSTVSPSLVSVKILIFFELRNLQIVEVDSWLPDMNILFSSILLTKMDFPELVSPLIKRIVRLIV